MDKDEMHQKIEELGISLGDTIMKLTNSKNAIIFYGYYDGTAWRYGSTGNGNLLERIGLCDVLKHELLNEDSLQNIFKKDE